MGDNNNPAAEGDPSSTLKMLRLVTQLREHLLIFNQEVVSTREETTRRERTRLEFKPNDLCCSGQESAAIDSTATATEQPFDSLSSLVGQHQQQQSTVATQVSAALAALITTTEAVDTATASASEADATTNSLTVEISNKPTRVNASAYTTRISGRRIAAKLAAVALAMTATVAEFPFDPVVAEECSTQVVNSHRSLLLLGDTFCRESVADRQPSAQRHQPSYQSPSPSCKQPYCSSSSGHISSPVLSTACGLQRINTPPHHNTQHTRHGRTRAVEWATYTRVE